MTTHKLLSRWLLAALLACGVGFGSSVIHAQELVRPTSAITPITPATAPEFGPLPADVAPTLPPEATFSNQGALFETPDGRIVYGQAIDQGFNPASAIKVATTYAVFQKYGPEYRFAQTLWTSGTLDNQTGTLNGDLIIAGRDPSFNYEHAVMLARDLNRQGIRTVTGDLVVSQDFTLNFSTQAQSSGEVLYDSLDAKRRPARVKKAWVAYKQATSDPDFTDPNVSVLGNVYVDNIPLNARQVMTRRSSKLVDIAKVMLCYSNNFLAEELGETVGGPVGLRNFLMREVGLRPEEVQLASTSGLGVNRVTPRAMMKTLRGFRKELAKNRLDFSDVMPVAGVDPGTLARRYGQVTGRGSVVGKTGTLIQTDSGASALVGKMNTPQGEVYFVIFNIRGNVPKFRASQDNLVAAIQNMYGGPVAFNYRPSAVTQKLLQTESDAGSNAEELDPNLQQK